MSTCAGDLANQRMVDRLIAEGALWSPALIAAFRETPRHRFLDRVFVYHQRHEGWREIDTSDPCDEDLELIYSDRALITRLAIAASGQQVPVSSSSQPSLMAEMLEDLKPLQGQRVLEVGTGTGYNAVLLAHVVGRGGVHTVDVDRAVLAEAASHFANFAEWRIQLHHGDGRQGWREAAPFDRIMVTAATPDLEPEWLAQMKEGGVLVAPLVLAPGLALVVRGEVRQGIFHGRLTRGAYFMPLRSEEEAPTEENPGGGTENLASPPENEEGGGGPRPLRSRPAPWAGWFARQRPRLGYGSFLQALVFYGWLRGLSVLHGDGPGGLADYGVLFQGAQCWFGSEDWQVSGPAGQELGEALWQAWLRAGGPWPTEFCLTAAANEQKLVFGPDCYLHQGPRCQQAWQLQEARERPGWR